MTSISYEQQLRDALVQLETALELPLIPGELAHWMPAVQQGFAAVGQYLRPQIEQSHREGLRIIKREDLGLARRVEQLEQEDEQILAQYDELASLADSLAAGAIAIEPDEAAIAPEHERLVNEGLNFVIRVRKQEAAMSTWLVEALERDRGDVD